jgi:hypothetical protein
MPLFDFIVKPLVAFFAPDRRPGTKIKRKKKAGGSAGSKKPSTSSQSVKKLVRSKTSASGSSRARKSSPSSGSTKASVGRSTGSTAKKSTKRSVKKSALPVTKKLVGRKKVVSSIPSGIKSGRGVKKVASRSTSTKKGTFSSDRRDTSSSRSAGSILIGEITHYFSRIGVAVLKLNSGQLKVGESLHIRGKKTDFTQQVVSMQIESNDVRMAKQGQIVGLKLVDEALPGDKVYKVR